MPVALNTADGHKIQATRTPTTGNYKGHLIVAGATGVAQRIYHRFVMRTARSRTSGKRRFYFLLMAPSSQSVKPLQNPGRFTRYLIGGLFFGSEHR